MTFTKLTLIACLFGIVLSASAQGFVTSAMGTRTVLKGYPDADGKGESAPLSVKDISFPLKVFEVSEAGFVRVKIADTDVWLDRKQIRIPPESMVATCLTVDRANAALVSGGIRGANSGCK